MCWSMSGSHGLWEPVTHPSYQPGWVEVVPRVGGVVPRVGVVANCSASEYINNW